MENENKVGREKENSSQVMSVPLLLSRRLHSSLFAFSTLGTL
jgi:hypothetical protein